MAVLGINNIQTKSNENRPMVPINTPYFGCVQHQLKCSEKKGNLPVNAPKYVTGLNMLEYERRCTHTYISI